MFVDFDYIIISGFRTFLNQTTFDLRAMPYGQLYFMRGCNVLAERLDTNGAGKSSIWAALTWCLYGKTVDNLRKGHLRTWRSKAHPHVIVGVRCDNQEHEIERTHNSLTIDGQSVGQEHVDTLVGMSFMLFTQAVLWGQEQPLFFDLEPRAKLSLFSDVLCLERWDGHSQNANTRARLLSDKVVELNAQASALTMSLENARATHERLKTQSNAWQQEQSGRMQKIDAQLQQLRTQLKPARKNLDNADLALDAASLVLDGIRTDLERVEKDYAVVHKNYTDFVVDSRAKQHEIAALVKQSEQFKGGKCPVCEQSIKGTAVDKHYKETQAKIARLSKLVGIPKTTVDRLQEFHGQIERLKAQAQTEQNKIDAAQSALNTWQPIVASTEANIRALETQQGERREENNPYHDQLQDIRRQIAKLNGEVKQADETAALYTRRSIRATAWIKGFKEVKLLQIEEVLHELEIATNNVIQDVGLVDWEVKYAIEQETQAGTTKRGINVSVLSPHNDTHVPWEVWCGGERQRLRIIGSLALSDVLLHHAGVDPSLTIIDEPTQHVSPRGITDIIEFLADQAPKLNRQIFLIDQHMIESGKFAGVITVVRDQDGSRIEMQE